uniref:Head tail connector protein n=1 Tax=viral metagenome TaxID=1070528 RepID=A0A6M3K5P1_9ZZZZ
MSLVTNAAYLYYLGVSQSETITNTITPLINSAEKRVKEFLNRDLEWTAYTDELYDGNGKSKLTLRQFPIIYVSTIKEYNGIDSNDDETWDTLVEHTDYDRLIIPIEAFCIYLDNYTFTSGDQNYKITYYAGYTAGNTLTTGSCVVGKKYRIAAHSVVDFTTIGSSSNTVGTQFVATGTASMSVSDSLTELIAVPEDIQLACKKLVALYWRSTPANQNFIGVQSLSDSAGSASNNINIDLGAEQRILDSIEHHKAYNV